MFLVVFTYLHKLGMGVKDSQMAALALALGAVGDFLIGSSREGIVTGAVPFGLGHLAFLVRIFFFFVDYISFSLSSPAVPPLSMCPWPSESSPGAPSSATSASCP